ncbi:HD family phosphohydrolase [Candidatus Omnitrophota bacterium]
MLPKKNNSNPFSQIGPLLAIIASLFLVAYLIGVAFVIPILLVIFLSYLRSSYKSLRGKVLQLALLISAILCAAKIIISYLDIPAYYIPVITLAMLTVILFDSLELALVLSVFASLSIGVMAGNNFILSFTLLIGGIVAAIFASGARRRSQIYKAGLFASVIQCFCIMLFSFHSNIPMHKIIGVEAAPVVAGGIIVSSIVLSSLHILFSGILASFLTLSSLIIFENPFKVATNFTLLELSDFNHPLMRRMILEAPGTYQHSLIVGNLAEAACEAIGVNSLLARVGSYYHDIGKIDKAEYFSENQMHAGSKHDKLQPSMSSLLIINHVKEGIELAKKYRLKPALIDFVAQHHGSSLVFYFYRRALEDHNEDGEKRDVEEERFRYPGPKPQTKETAIVLLADSVEAASRTLTDPNPNRIEELVRKIINNKFIDGQLDECELTLKEIERIATTFIKILSAIYHTRVAYPEETNGKKNNNKHTKSSKEVSGQNSNVQKERPQDTPFTE